MTLQKKVFAPYLALMVFSFGRLFLCVSSLTFR